MKKTILLLLLASFSALAGPQEFGLGVMLGNPTGLNGKYWLDEDHAIDGGIGWSIGKHSAISVHSDYLFHNAGAFFFNDVHPLDLYYGLGGRMGFADDFNLGIRGPVGLAHRLADEPIDVFLEVAPILDLISTAGFELNLAIGGRYYFE